LESSQSEVGTHETGSPFVTPEVVHQLLAMFQNPSLLLIFAIIVMHVSVVPYFR
jgi:hypothetical protein